MYSLNDWKSYRDNLISIKDNSLDVKNRYIELVNNTNNSIIKDIDNAINDFEDLYQDILELQTHVNDMAEVVRIITIISKLVKSLKPIVNTFGQSVHKLKKQIDSVEESLRPFHKIAVKWIDLVENIRPFINYGDKFIIRLDELYNYTIDPTNPTHDVFDKGAVTISSDNYNNRRNNPLDTVDEDYDDHIHVYGKSIKYLAKGIGEIKKIINILSRISNLLPVFQGIRVDIGNMGLIRMMVNPLKHLLIVLNTPITIRLGSERLRLKIMSLVNKVLRVKVDLKDIDTLLNKISRLVEIPLKQILNRFEFPFKHYDNLSKFINIPNGLNVDINLPNISFNREFIINFDDYFNKINTEFLFIKTLQIKYKTENNHQYNEKLKTIWLKYCGWETEKYPENSQLCVIDGISQYCALWETVLWCSDVTRAFRECIDRNGDFGDMSELEGYDEDIKKFMINIKSVWRQWWGSNKKIYGYDQSQLLSPEDGGAWQVENRLHLGRIVEEFLNERGLDNRRAEDKRQHQNRLNQLQNEYGGQLELADEYQEFITSEKERINSMLTSFITN